MDTIETSNLNRQFLFRKHHVGESKAKVAAEAVKRFRPNARIQADQVQMCADWGNSQCIAASQTMQPGRRLALLDTHPLPQRQDPTGGCYLSFCALCSFLKQHQAAICSQSSFEI